MRTRDRHFAQIGEVVAVAFDEARACSKDPAEVSRLAAGAVMRVLARAAPARGEARPSPGGRGARR
jgi:hypothetical protein